MSNVHYLDESGAQEAIDFYGYDPIARYSERMCDLVGVREVYEYEMSLKKIILQLSQRIDELERRL